MTIELETIEQRAAWMQAILERIMTQHWDDLQSCGCWVCQEARVAGCRPNDAFPVYGDDPYFTRVQVKWPQPFVYIY